MHCINPSPLCRKYATLSRCILAEFKRTTWQTLENMMLPKAAQTPTGPAPEYCTLANSKTPGPLTVRLLTKLSEQPETTSSYQVQDNLASQSCDLPHETRRLAVGFLPLLMS